MDERSCAWMTGPRDATVKVSSVKWWLALSRDLLPNEYRRQMSRSRPPVSCDLTPTFTSPLSNKPT